MPTKKLSILGSTGSIGTQALSLAEALGIEITAISGNRNAALLERQALRFKPRYLCAVDGAAYAHLRVALAATGTKVLGGEAGLSEMMRADDSDTALAAIVGIAGLPPTVAAIEAGKNIALANKETLVAAGSCVTGLAAKRGVRLIPVDSEHSAIFQCLQDAASARTLARIILTASGGPFFGFTPQRLKGVKPREALKHPNWTMGAKVTIDSATMMNKGLEIIEAMWLFGLKAGDIEVAVHRQSIVHSLVEFRDGAVLAQLGEPDMRLPIQYALTWPDRAASPAGRLDIPRLGALTFEPADSDTFRCLAACRRAAEIGGAAPCAANAANEIAVELFLKERIGFLDIGRAVERAVELASGGLYGWGSLEDVIEADRAARRGALEYLGNR
jgi:1-deoxy-D-xylulose-5-phosphate reductoisomerase